MRAPGASIATSWTSRRPLLLVVLIGLLLAGRDKIGIVGGRDPAALAAPLIARRKLTAVTDLVAVRHSYTELNQAAAWQTAKTTEATQRLRVAVVLALP